MGRAILGRRLALPGPMGQCASAHSIHLSRCSREVWAAWRALFFFLIKEPVAVSNEVPCKPFVSAETLKACALVGLHLLAAESEEGSSGSQSSD